jgi:hypothetical protein
VTSWWLISSIFFYGFDLGERLIGFFEYGSALLKVNVLA